MLSCEVGGHRPRGQDGPARRRRRPSLRRGCCWRPAPGRAACRWPRASEHCLYLRTHDDAGESADDCARMRASPSSAAASSGSSSPRRPARGCGGHGDRDAVAPAARRSRRDRGNRARREHERQGVRMLLSAGSSTRRTRRRGRPSHRSAWERRRLRPDRIEADLVIVGIGAVPECRTGRGRRARRRQRHRGRRVPADQRPGDLRRRRLLLLPARNLWRPARAAGSLAQRAGTGGARRRQHAGRRRSSCLRAVVLVGSVRPRRLQIAGLADEGAPSVRRDLGDGAFILFHLAADGRLVAASGIGPGNAVARDIRLAEMLIARRAARPPTSLPPPRRN